MPLYLRAVLALALSADNVLVSVPLPLHETFRSLLETSSPAEMMLQLRGTPDVARALEAVGQLRCSVPCAEVLVAFCRRLVFRSPVLAALRPWSPARGVERFWRCWDRVGEPLCVRGGHEGVERGGRLSSGLGS